MKLTKIVIILIVCTFVLATCSEWSGDEGYVNIRISGLNRISSGGRTIVLNQGLDSDNVPDELFIDIYFLKELVDGTKQKPKEDSLVAARGKLKYKSTTSISLVPGTYIVVLSAWPNQKDGIVAQGVLTNVTINPGKNEDIDIPVISTVNELEYKEVFYEQKDPIYDPETGYIIGYNPGTILEETGKYTYQYINPIFPDKKDPFLKGIDF